MKERRDFKKITATILESTFKKEENKTLANKKYLGMKTKFQGLQKVPFMLNHPIYK